MSYKIRYIPDFDAAFIKNTLEPSMERIEEIQDRYDELEVSILNGGVRNPVVLTAQNDIIEPRYGGTRIHIAQKHGLVVPAIIADFDDRFPDAETIETWEVENKFVDKPKKIKFKPYGINVSGLPGLIE